MNSREYAIGSSVASGLVNIGTGITDHGYNSLVRMASNPSTIFGTHEGAVNGWTPDAHGNLIPATREMLPNVTHEQFAVAGLEIGTALLAFGFLAYGVTHRNKTPRPYLRLVK